MDEKSIKKLLATMKCSLCGSHYSPGNINILGHKESMWFLSVFCPSCKSQGLVAAVVKEGKAIEAEVLTELTAEEVKSLTTPLGSDDLLDMHTFLSDFDGDFSALFRK